MKFQARTAALLAVTSITVSLSGCLVEKEKVAAKTYASLTNVLYTYRAGDTITYDYVKVTSSGTSTGTLEVKWEAIGQIQDPFDNNHFFTVLKETTNIYPSGTTPLDGDVAVRFIEQDSTTGTIYLRAIDDLVSTTNYWLSSQSNVPPGTLDRVEIFRSPILLGSANAIEIDFNVMSGCTGTSCQPSLGSFYNRLEANSGSEVVKGTGKGTFSNVYRLTYGGDLTPVDQTPLPFFDFLDICHVTGSANTQHSGTLYVVPEVGVIKVINSCRSGTEQPVQYIATLRDTNITLPPLTN